MKKIHVVSLVAANVVFATAFAASVNVSSYDVSKGDCKVQWPGTSIYLLGKSGAVGTVNTRDGAGVSEPRFLCVGGKIVDCGWEVTNPAVTTKAASGSTWGNFICALKRVGNGKWVPKA